MKKKSGQSKLSEALLMDEFKHLAGIRTKRTWTLSEEAEPAEGQEDGPDVHPDGDDANADYDEVESPAPGAKGTGKLPGVKDLEKPLNSPNAKAESRRRRASMSEASIEDDAVVVKFVRYASLLQKSAAELEKFAHAKDAGKAGDAISMIEDLTRQISQLAKQAKVI